MLILRCPSRLGCIDLFFLVYQIAAGPILRYSGYNLDVSCLLCGWCRWSCIWFLVSSVVHLEPASQNCGPHITCVRCERPDVTHHTPCFSPGLKKSSHEWMPLWEWEKDCTDLAPFCASGQLTQFQPPTFSGPCPPPGFPTLMLVVAASGRPRTWELHKWSSVGIAHSHSEQWFAIVSFCICNW